MKERARLFEACSRAAKAEDDAYRAWLKAAMEHEGACMRLSSYAKKGQKKNDEISR